MRVKASWAAFAPVTLGALLIHMYYIFFIGGGEITQQLFGQYSLLINEQTEPEIIVILGGVLFAFCLLFFLIDRKTAPVCDYKSGVLSGIFLVVSGLLLGVQSAVGLMTGFSAAENAMITAVFELFSIVVVLIFAIVGMGMLIGFNIAKKIRFLMLFPVVWTVIGMLNTFSSHRKDAPSFAFFDVFAWVFLSLFMFNCVMVLCGIEVKNPVKSSFLYGTVYILFAIAYLLQSIGDTINEFGYFEFTNVMSPLVLASLAVFAFFYLTRLSKIMITKKKAAELNGEEVFPDEDEIQDDETDEDDYFPEAAFGVGSTKYVTAEFEKIRLEKAAQKAKERTGSIPIVGAEESVPTEEDQAVSTLDKIDQLILELSESDD